MNLWKFLVCSKVNQILKGVFDSPVLTVKKNISALPKKKKINSYGLKYVTPSTPPPLLGNANTFALKVKLRPLVVADSSILI